MHIINSAGFLKEPVELLKEFQALRNVFASKIPLEVKDLWGQDLRLDFAEAQSVLVGVIEMESHP